MAIIMAIIIRGNRQNRRKWQVITGIFAYFCYNRVRSIIITDTFATSGELDYNKPLYSPLPVNLIIVIAIIISRNGDYNCE